MRQHVNPLSKHFHKIEFIPPLEDIFEDPQLPLHLDIGSASGDFLYDLALENNKWNYFGIEIREKLVNNAKSRIIDREINNLYFAFGNVINIFNDPSAKSVLNNLKSLSFNFPDPWFKKKHHKRRVIQPDLIKILANSIQKDSLIFIKTDVEELFYYMDSTILSDPKFKKLENIYLNKFKIFNPNKIQTSREKYVIANKLKIFERIYIKT